MTFKKVPHDILTGDIIHEINLSEASGFGENSTLLEINWNISDAPPQVYERKNELPVERFVAFLGELKQVFILMLAIVLGLIEHSSH